MKATSISGGTEADVNAWQPRRWKAETTRRWMFRHFSRRRRRPQTRSPG
jgi:hypothetical protein